MVGVPGTAERLFARAARRRRVGDDDLAGLVRAFDLLRGPRRPGAARSRRGRGRVRRRDRRQRRSQGVHADRRHQRAGRGRRRHGRHARRGRAPARRRSRRRGSTCARSRRARASATSRSRSPSTDATRALRAAHAAFWLSPQTLSVGVIGPGQVGRALLAQLAAALPRLRTRSNLDLRLRALANSRAMHAGRARRRAGRRDGARCDGGAARARSTSTRFAAHVHAEHLPHALIVDCSASDAVAARYRAVARRPASTWSRPTSTPAAATGRATPRSATRSRSGGGRFRYEATVGAGLPVIQTLRNLLDTGDELHGIDGMLSGTLAWLFNRFDGSVPFSQLVREAQRAGLHRTRSARRSVRPRCRAQAGDPGARSRARAVARRMWTWRAWCREALREVGREEFLARLEELDAPMQARWTAARAQRRALRHRRAARPRRPRQRRRGRAAARSRLPPYRA